MGLLTCGLAAGVTVLAAGIVYGIQFHALVTQLGLGKVMAVTLPHGIFEIGGLWIAGAVGLSGCQVLRLIKEPGEIKEFCHQNVLAAAIAVALTIIGALVEGRSIWRI